MSEENKTYQINVVCSNCGHYRETPIAIPEGTYCEEYLVKKDFTCGNCGCKKCLDRSC